MTHRTDETEEHAMDDTIEQQTNRTEQSGRSERAGRTRRLVAVAAGTTIALGAGGVAYAATTTPEPTPSTTEEATPGAVPDDGTTHEHGRPPMGGGLMAGGPAMLHGEAVVETDDGVYETVLSQRGTVDAISDDTLTVTSEDGFTQDYVLDTAALEEADRGPATDLSAIAVGDEVVVMATVDGSTATVQHLVEPPSDGALGGPGGPGHGPHGDRPDGLVPPDAENSSYGSSYGQA